jgi:hypothetical protein
MTKDLAASVRARLLNIAKSEGSNFNQLLVRYLRQPFTRNVVSSADTPGSVDTELVRRVVGHSQSARPVHAVMRLPCRTGRTMNNALRWLSQPG